VHIVPKVLPRSLCGWPRTSLHLLKEGHNHLIVRFAYLCLMIGKELVFFVLVVHQAFQSWCRSRFQQAIHGYPPRSSFAQITISSVVPLIEGLCSLDLISIRVLGFTFTSSALPYKVDIYGLGTLDVWLDICTTCPTLDVYLTYVQYMVG